MTDEISKLPQPIAIEQAMQISALLEIVLCEEEWLRCTRYDPSFAPNLRLGMIDNGAGDHLIVIFSEQGTIIKGFDHESPFSPYALDTFEVYPGIYDTTPPPLLRLLDDAALEADHVTFCMWQGLAGTQWEQGVVHNPDGDSDGSAFLLNMIHYNAESFVNWVKYYYEREIDLEIVRALYNGKSLTVEDISHLNPQRSIEQVKAEVGALQSELDDSIS